MATDDTFICAKCGQPFVKARSDEEAAAELMENLGVEHKESDAVVCDPCYREFLRWWRATRN